MPIFPLIYSLFKFPTCSRGAAVGKKPKFERSESSFLAADTKFCNKRLSPRVDVRPIRSPKPNTANKSPHDGPPASEATGIAQAQNKETKDAADAGLISQTPQIATDQTSLCAGARSWRQQRRGRQSGTLSHSREQQPCRRRCVHADKS